jgi:hypothetical protein
MDLNTIYFKARERIDAQLSANNYKGYTDTLENAIYEAYSLAIQEMTLEVLNTSHRLTQKTQDDEL